jgi:uncharacterized SAM-binding protein YcdF (DUF218 family)
VTEILSALLLPPGVAIWLLLAGMVTHHWRRWTGRWLLVIAMLIMVLSSSEAVGHRALASLQTSPPLAGWPAGEEPVAMVVLGGGIRSRAPAYHGEDVPSPLTLERLRYAALLAKAHPVDVLLSGGRKREAASPEAVLMNQVMVEDYGVPVRWLESESTSTEDNARLAAELLRKAGIHKIVLVTHAWHMPRAKMLFERQKLDVVPAPVGFVPESPMARPRWLAYLPSARGLALTALALREKWAYWWQSGQSDDRRGVDESVAQASDRSSASAN